MSKPYQIDTDGWTVWINEPASCLARITAGIAEVFPTPETSEALIPEDWRRWRSRVKEVHGIEVPENLRPRW